MLGGSGMLEVPQVGSWFSDKVRKAESGIHGTGLFAADNITRGEELVTKGGILMTWRQIQLLGPRASTSWLQVGANRFLAAATEEQCDAVMTCVNHTCDWSRVNIGMQGDITGVAMCDIPKGAELLYFYPTFFVHPEWRMPCACGYARCRKVLHGRVWQELAVQEHFGEFFTRYALSLIKAQRAAARS